MRPRPRVLALSLLLAAPLRAETPVPAAPSLADFYAALARPAVLGVAPAPELLRVGRAEIRPLPGARLLVLAAAGNPCAWVLDGEARLSYRIEDRFSVPVARRNLARASGLTVQAEGAVLRVGGTLRGAAVWGWDLELPDELTPAPATELPAWLRELLERRLDGNPARDTLLAARNGDAGYRWAAFRMAGDDLTLDVDPRPAVRLEVLSRRRRLESTAGTFSGRLVDEELAAQPTSGAWWEGPTVDFATTETDLEVVNDQGDHVVIRAKTKVQSLRAGLRLLGFSLVHTKRGAGQRARHLRITRLLVDGREAPFVHSEAGDLLVELPERLQLKQAATLEVSAEGDLLERPAGDSYWTLGLEPWYPVPGGLGSEWSAIRIVAESRAPFVPFAGGEVGGREQTTAGQRVTTALAAPMQGGVVLAGKYTTITEEHEGRRVHVSTYASVKEDEARRLARIVLSVRSCLEGWLAVPYPFQDLQLIEINEWGWGQAPPGIIFITKEAFLTPARARLGEDTQVMASLTTRGVNARIAHEVAHGWFPHVAKILRTEENWLSESFSDYVSAVCLERAMNDKRQARTFWDQQLRDWRSFAQRAGDGTSIFLAAHLTEHEDDAFAWYYLLYGKGPLVLHALRQELGRQAGGAEAGDRQFFTWMRAAVQNFTYKPVETRHLVALLEQISGKPWQPWFERYVYGTETPVVD
jgi:hypothetical protein